MALDDILASASAPSRHFSTSRVGDDFDIKVDVNDGMLEILVPRDRVTVSEPDIFILWMVGSALILLGVAILFLRNQVRPIERLARAADSVRQGPAGARLQALWRHRSAPRRPGLHHHARAHRALCRTSAPKCWRA